MGSVLAAYELVKIVVSACKKGQKVAIETLQYQIRKKIKEHQKEFEELRQIKGYMEILLDQDNFNLLKKKEKEV